jgi:hypothetical protein
VTDLRLGAGSPLAGALQAAMVSQLGEDVYLVLRTAGNTVLWSGMVTRWSTDHHSETTVCTTPVADQIERQVTHYRAMQELKLAEAGLLSNESR